MSKMKDKAINAIGLVLVLLFGKVPIATGAESDTLTAISYERLVGSSQSSQIGMVGVYQVGEKTYLEIPDSLLGRDLLAVNRISKGWAGDKPFDPFLNFIGYSGDLMGETLFRFYSGEDGALVVNVVDYANRVQSANGEPMLPPNADLLPVFYSFTILCRNKTDDASLVDGTDFISGDNAVMTFSGSLRKKFEVGPVNGKYSSLKGIEVTATHTVTSSIKTYGYKNGESVRLGVRSTWFLLPKIPYSIRKPDHRVGYFTRTARDYSNPFKPEQNLDMVERWRMEPRQEDKDAYFRGELVVPIKPIVIYIDPEMPEEWVPYMIQGVNDWQPAFEQAGFKNAIHGERVPPEAAAKIVGDARYSMICYKPSHVRNATAELVTDPRSGEILNANIAWYHGHMQNILKWGRLMGAVHRDGLRGNMTDTAFIGAMIRKIITHEVGHVLGLLHNFGASSTVPVKNLRDPKWLAEHPISPSIMDYVRVNYVAQPEDGVPLSGLIPRLGPYDRWAITWGYRLHPPTGSPTADRQRLNRWTTETCNTSDRWYGSQDLQTSDSRCQSEDLGNNPVLAATYGILNLKTLIDSLNYWFPSAYQAQQVYKDIVSQYFDYLGHVGAVIGDRSHGDASSGTASERALHFIREQFITPPIWLLEGAVEHLGVDPIDMMKRFQEDLIGGLISRAALHGKGQELINLQQWVFQQASGSPTVSRNYTESLRWAYTLQLLKAAYPENLKPGQSPTPQQLTLRKLAIELRATLQVDGYHLLITELTNKTQ